MSDLHRTFEGAQEPTPEQHLAEEAERRREIAEELAQERREAAEEDAETREEFLRELTTERLLTDWNALREGGGTNLLAIDTSTPIEWVPGAEQIIRRRERATWLAKQGEGKTQAALQLGVQVVCAGGRVIYMDVENDAREMAERLKSIVASFGPDAEPAYLERFSYLDRVTLAQLGSTEDLAKVWVHSILVSDLIILDSLTRLLIQCEKDEDSNQDIAEWMGEYIDPIAKFGGGAAVLMLDNTGHQGDRARGAINKAALVETVYSASGGSKVDPDTHGTLALTRKRSRSGRVARFLTAEAGGGDYGPLVPKESAPPTTTSSQQAEVTEARREAIIELLGAADGGYLNMKALTEAFRNQSPNTLRSDMDALIKDGAAAKWSEADGTPKPGRGDWWKSRP